MIPTSFHTTSATRSGRWQGVSTFYVQEETSRVIIGARDDDNAIAGRALHGKLCCFNVTGVKDGDA